MRWFKSVVSTVAPSIEWPWWWNALAFGFASWFTWVASMNMAVRWMVYGILFNMAATILVALFVPNKRGSMHIKQDACVKAMSFWLVWLMGKESILQAEVFGKPVAVAMLFAGYFLTGEWIGFLQRMDELVPNFAPKWAKAALQRANDSLSNVDIKSSVMSAVTSFTQQADGSTETISRTSTVTTTKPEAPSA